MNSAAPKRGTHDASRGAIPLRGVARTQSADVFPPVDASVLNAVFFALCDPTRRGILERLEAQPALVSELATPFAMSLQAVSRHIQVLVRAGLVRQERSGRIMRCELVAGPIFDAAVWLNRYTRYWQTQFDALAGALASLPAAADTTKPSPTPAAARTRRTRTVARTGRGAARKTSPRSSRRNTR